MVNSTVDFKMVSTRKKEQHEKRLHRQLSEFDADFLIVHNNHEAQTEGRVDMVDRDTSLNNTIISTQVNNPQKDMHTLEKNIASKVEKEVDSVMTTVKTRVQDAMMTAIENIVIPRVEIALQ